jgi:sugar lactone lactonase YvrE
VYRIERDGAASVVATIDYGVQNDYYCSQAGSLGMAVSADGDVWVAVISWLPESHGIWRVGQDGWAELAVPMSFEDAPVPNALAFDRHGNLYVTETFLGGIWKVPPDGEPTLWLQSELLLPPGGPGAGFGANGIAYRHRALYVANSDQGTVVRIPIRIDGSPGEPTVIAGGLNGPDGLAFDAFGRLYAVTAYGGELVRVRRWADPEVVVDLRAAGADYPASVDFLKGGANTAIITNFVPLEGQPNIVKVNLCERVPCPEH